MEERDLAGEIRHWERAVKLLSETYQMRGEAQRIIHENRILGSNEGGWWSGCLEN